MAVQLLWSVMYRLVICSYACCHQHVISLSLKPIPYHLITVFKAFSIHAFLWNQLCNPLPWSWYIQLTCYLCLWLFPFQHLIKYDQVFIFFRLVFFQVPEKIISMKWTKCTCTRPRLQSPYIFDICIIIFSFKTHLYKRKHIDKNLMRVLTEPMLLFCRKS